MCPSFSRLPSSKKNTRLFWKGVAKWTRYLLTCEWPDIWMIMINTKIRTPSTRANQSFAATNQTTRPHQSQRYVMALSMQKLLDLASLAGWQCLIQWVHTHIRTCIAGGIVPEYESANMCTSELAPVFGDSCFRGKYYTGWSLGHRCESSI